MKSTIEYFVSIFLFIFGLFIAISFMMESKSISLATKYEEEIVHEIESSNFNTTTINQCISEANSKGYTITIVEDTINKQMPKYKVTMKYPIKMNLFGLIEQHELISYAI